MPAWSPDGTQLAFVTNRHGNFDIYTIPVAGGTLTRMTRHSSPDIWPSWSPDGKTIYTVTSPGAFQPPILRRVTPGGSASVIRHPFKRISRISLSPDGQKIALAASKKGTTHIWIMNSDGSGATQLTKWDAKDICPAWSPDGTTVAFASNKKGNWDIWMVAVNGGEPESLTDSSASEKSPCWSPDSKKVAYTSDREGVVQVYIFNVDGGGERALSRSKTDLAHPAWSPDGKWIAVDTMRAGFSQLSILDVSDGSETPIEFPGGVSMPFWGIGAKDLGFIASYHNQVDPWRAVLK